ncbi:MAG: hypothetical protein QM731_26115 [Chitinophagaceae bacterium]
MTEQQQTPATADNGKTVAMLSYLTIIGWIVALMQHNNNKTTLGAFHLRQSIALFITAIAFWVVQILFVFIPYIGWLISIAFMFVYIGLFVLWIVGFIAALNGQEKAVPVIGDKAQEWFHGVG